jgi:hypothetical protein
MKRVEPIWFIILYLLLVTGCSHDQDAEDTPDAINDTMYACNASKIYQDAYLLFNDIDLAQFSYTGLDTITFLKNNKDTFVFTGIAKQKGKLKFEISPCRYYFNNWDTSLLQYSCSKLLYPLVIRQQVEPKGDGVFLPYYGYFEKDPPVLHTFSIAFNNLSFRAQASPVPIGGLLEISSSTLLSYKVFLGQGGIRKFVIQGGDTWVVIP